jgi:hypothetical protein
LQTQSGSADGGEIVARGQARERIEDEALGTVCTEVAALEKAALECRRKLPADAGRCGPGPRDRDGQERCELRGRVRSVRPLALAGLRGWGRAGFPECAPLGPPTSRCPPYVAGSRCARPLAPFGAGLERPRAVRAPAAVQRARECDQHVETCRDASR